MATQDRKALHAGDDSRDDRRTNAGYRTWCPTCRERGKPFRGGYVCRNSGCRVHMYQGKTPEEP